MEFNKASSSHVEFQVVHCFLIRITAKDCGWPGTEGDGDEEDAPAPLIRAQSGRVVKFQQVDRLVNFCYHGAF
jgi:hypothetical protein